MSIIVDYVPIIYKAVRIVHFQTVFLHCHLVFLLLPDVCVSPGARVNGGMMMRFSVEHRLRMLIPYVDKWPRVSARNDCHCQSLCPCIYHVCTYIMQENGDIPVSPVSLCPLLPSLAGAGAEGPPYQRAHCSGEHGSAGGRHVVLRRRRPLHRLQLVHKESPASSRLHQHR